MTNNETDIAIVNTNADLNVYQSGKSPDRSCCEQGETQQTCCDTDDESGRGTGQKQVAIDFNEWAG